MVKKIKCHCGCGSQVSASTERRHRAGKATPRVKASHAARRTLYAPKHLPQASTSKEMGLRTGCSSAPEISSHPGGHAGAHMPSSSNPNMGGGDFNVEFEMWPTSTPDRTWNISGIDTDDSQISEAMAIIQEQARHPQYRVTVEDYGSDDEGDEDPSDDDGIDWHAEISNYDSEKYYADGGLGVDETINEDFEQMLTGFGDDFAIRITLYSRNSLCVFPQLRKSPRMKLPSFATSPSRSRAT